MGLSGQQASDFAGYQESQAYLDAPVTAEIPDSHHQEHDIGKTAFNLTQIRFILDELTNNYAPYLLSSDERDAMDVATGSGTPPNSGNAIATLADIAALGGGDLLAANNLSDLASIPTARTNLDVYDTGAVDTAVNAKLDATGGTSTDQILDWGNFQLRRDSGNNTFQLRYSGIEIFKVDENGLLYAKGFNVLP